MKEFSIKYYEPKEINKETIHDIFRVSIKDGEYWFAGFFIDAKNDIPKIRKTSRQIWAFRSSDTFDYIIDNLLFHVKSFCVSTKILPVHKDFAIQQEDYIEIKEIK